MTLRRPVLWLLLAAALFVRAALPQGYMPERTDGGTVEVVVCGSGGAHRIAVGGDGEAPGKGGKPASEPCAFASFAAAPPPPAWQLPAAPFAAASGWFDPGRSSSHTSVARLRPPARGPPQPV